MTPILIELPQDPYRIKVRCADLAPGPKCRFTVTFTPTAAIVLILDRISALLRTHLSNFTSWIWISKSTRQRSAVERSGPLWDLPRASQEEFQECSLVQSPTECLLGINKKVYKLTPWWLRSTSTVDLTVAINGCFSVEIDFDGGGCF